MRGSSMILVRQIWREDQIIKILAIDIGAGTEDVLLYDDKKRLEKAMNTKQSIRQLNLKVSILERYGIDSEW